MVHSHIVHLPLGALLTRCTMCGTGNWAELRAEHDAQPPKRRGAKGKGAGRPLPPAYGVAQATQALFGACQLRVRYNVWWVERASCAAADDEPARTSVVAVSG